MSITVQFHGATPAKVDHYGGANAFLTIGVSDGTGNTVTLFFPDRSAAADRRQIPRRRNGRLAQRCRMTRLVDHVCPTCNKTWRASPLATVTCNHNDMFARLRPPAIARIAQEAPQ